MSVEPLAPSSQGPAAMSTFDRRVLLGLVAFAGGGLVAMWAGSRGFMPGARLYPYFVAAAGIAVAVLAFLRVWTGRESRAGAGQVVDVQVEVPARAYARAIRLMAGVSLYFAGVFSIGMLASTAIYIFSFLKSQGESFRYSAASAIICILVAYGLSRTLDLYLPLGWIAERLISGWK